MFCYHQNNWDNGLWANMIAPVNYNLLARGTEVNDEHSAIIES